MSEKPLEKRMNMPLFLKFNMDDEDNPPTDFEVIHHNGNRYTVIRGGGLLVDDSKTYPSIVRYVGQNGTEFYQLFGRFCGFSEKDGKKVPRFTPVEPPEYTYEG